MGAYKHLAYEDRVKIKTMLDGGHSKQEVADALHVHLNTIYNELRRGANGAAGYDPDYSEQQYREILRAKGAERIISEPLAQYISQLILQEGLSLLEVMDKLKEEKPCEVCPSSVNTIYSAIDAGLIPGVTRNTLATKTITMFSDGQLRIPKWIREQLKLHDGMSFEVKVNKNGSITLRKQ